MRIHVYGSGGEVEASRVTSNIAGLTAAAALPTTKGGTAAFLDIHYHGANAADLVANPTPSQGSTAAFLDIHYHGSQAAGDLVAARGVGEGAAAESGLMSASSVVSNALSGRSPVAAQPAVARPGGTAAFLDIHYHGANAADLVANPTLSQGSTAAFLDIHYHGSQAAGDLVAARGMGEGAAAESGLMSASSVVSNALSGHSPVAAQPAVARPGGTAAFLDIHYHGANAADLVANPTLSQGSTAAFLDIHYHGSQAAGDLVAARGVGEGAAAESGLMSASSVVSNALSGRSPVAAQPAVARPGGTAAFLDIHYHGKSLLEADVKGIPGLHIGDAALLDIHYHG